MATALTPSFFERSILHPPYPPSKFVLVHTRSPQRPAGVQITISQGSWHCRRLQMVPGRSFHTVDPPISTPCSAQALKSEYIAPSLASTSLLPSLKQTSQTEPRLQEGNRRHAARRRQPVPGLLPLASGVWHGCASMWLRPGTWTVDLSLNLLRLRCRQCVFGPLEPVVLLWP